jgi:hypothetical protein
MMSKQTDRELLKEMFDFLAKRNYIEGTPQSIKDMVVRYQQPPLTMYHRVCMQMTKKDYDNLGKLLERVLEHFAPAPAVEETINEPT